MTLVDFNLLMDFMDELEGLGIIIIEEEDSLVEKIEEFLEDQENEKFGKLFDE